MSTSSFSSSSTPPPPHEIFRDYHHEWMRRQEADISELVTAVSRDRQHRDETELRRLVAKSLDCYQDYFNHHRTLASADVLSIASPGWCTSLENSVLWLGGFRPTVVVRLIYSLLGNDFEAHLAELMSAVKPDGLCGLTATQLARVDDLHMRTIRHEDRLSKCMAMLQEKWTDIDLAMIPTNLDCSAIGPELAEATDPYLKKLTHIMEDADELRMETLRELMMGVLTPLQGSELMLGMKRLHVVLSKSGMEKDREREASIHR